MCNCSNSRWFPSFGLFNVILYKLTEGGLHDQTLPHATVFNPDVVVTWFATILILFSCVQLDLPLQGHFCYVKLWIDAQDYFPGSWNEFKIDEIDFILWSSVSDYKKKEMKITQSLVSLQSALDRKKVQNKESVNAISGWKIAFQTKINKCLFFMSFTPVQLPFTMTNVFIKVQCKAKNTLSCKLK